MRTIIDIYDQYNIPQTHRMHMLRVAGAAELIIKNWSGENLNRNKIIRVLLLHDIGNIVKSTFDKAQDNSISNKEDFDYWENMKKEIINKYGNDDHKASYLISKEIGLNEAELALMNAKIFVKNDITVKSPDYHLKISAYADQRVAPNGILPLFDRLLEAKERYKDKPGSSMNNPKTDLLIQCAQEIEKQILAKCSIKPNDINDYTVEPEIHNLINYSFE